MIATPLTLAALATLLAGAVWLWTVGAHWAFVAGTGLAAGAPLAFMIGHLRNRKPMNEHPLLISILSGLGCVTDMIAIQRFGSDHEWALFASVGALALWTLWQRRERTRFRPPQA